MSLVTSILCGISLFCLCFGDLDEDKRTGCYALVVFLFFRGCLFSVALPRGSVGQTAVCECSLS